jgi:outer membrane protein OmpA-like peptidoglycan-associated protein
VNVFLSSINSFHNIGGIKWKPGITKAIRILLLVFLATPVVTHAGVNLDIQSLPLSAKLVKKGFDAPLNALIPAVDGMHITWARFRSYEEKSFRVDKQKVKAAGRYWKLEYKPSGKTSIDIPGVVDEYRKLLEKRAAAVTVGKKGKALLFRVTTGGHQYVIKLSVFRDSIAVAMIETEAFKQTLKISPDELRAELVNSGKVTLEGVFFDFDKATLQPRSRLAIEAAAVLLRKYPDLELEVQGHTDAKGNRDYNQKLSQRRAASVVQAIEEKGIDAKRLIPKGYGSSNPVASNDSEAGRSKNRRVELHRIRGGELKALIGIDFIKPIPGAIEKQRWHYDNEENQFRYRKPYAKKRSQKKVVGSVERIQWRFEKNGKLDRSVSAKEIINNYLGVLELLGAQVTAVENNSLYFYLADRGDGQEAFGIIRTDSSGTYQLSFIVPAAASVAAPRKTVDPQKTAKPGGAKQRSSQSTQPKSSVSDLEGKWFFDEQATRKQLSADTDLSQYSGLVVGLSPDGVLYYYGAKSGKWKYEAGRILVSQDGKQWEPAPMKMVAGRLTMKDGELTLMFSRQAPAKKVETAGLQTQQLTKSTATSPWTLDEVIVHLGGLQKLQYSFENVHHIKDIRTWHLKREGGQLLSRLYSKNQGEFIDSDWVYFDTKAGDASNGPLVSSGLRSRKKMRFEAVARITVPAGTFDCTKVHTRDRYGEPVEAWLIDARPGIPAKIVTHNATYQLERIYP